MFVTINSGSKFMTNINPYLNFNGNCREAMSFYKECIGGELALQTIAGSRIEDECPAAMKQQILHASLIMDGIVLMGSDMTGPDGFIKGNTMALSVNCSSEKEITDFFFKLSQGGKILHPLKKEFHGATFGIFTDKFGIRWMLNYDKRY